MDKVSVITIVYNDKEHILDTMCSVIEQTYDRIEYILIDGKSSDGTIELIIDKIQDVASVSLRTKDDDKLYIEAIDRLNPSKTYKILSQKDSGIYDAMNKGVDLAIGKWCNFMNCGDRFYDNNVINKMFIDSQINEEVLLVYGRVALYYKDDFISYYGNARIIPHQGSFFDMEYLKNNKFDINYKIYADGKLIDKIVTTGYSSLIFKNIVVASFELGGIGNHPKYALKRIKEKNMLSFSNLKLKFVLFECLGIIIWILFGEKIYYNKFQKFVIKVWRQ